MASSLPQKQVPSGSKGASEPVKQRLIIIRHGERLDNVDPDWERTAERPYDPPLTEDGKEEVRTVGQERFSGKVGRSGKSSGVLSVSDFCLRGGWGRWRVQYG